MSQFMIFASFCFKNAVASSELLKERSGEDILSKKKNIIEKLCKCTHCWYNQFKYYFLLKNVDKIAWIITYLKLLYH